MDIFIKEYQQLLVLLICLAACSATKQDDQRPLLQVGQLLDQARQHKVNQIDSAFFFAKEAYRVARQEKDKKSEALSYLVIGELYYLRGAFHKANEHLILVLDYFRKHPGKHLGETYNLLGLVYQYTNQHHLVMDHYRLALSTYLALNDQQGLAETYGNIGHFFEKSSRYDSALSYQQKAKNIYVMIEDSAGLATIYDNIGSIYEDNKDFEQAKANFQNAYDLNKAIGNKVSAIINLNNLGDIHRKKEEYSDALSITNLVLNQARSFDQPYQIRSAYRDLSKIYYGMKSFQKSLMYLDSAYEINAEIYSEEIAREIANTRAVYEVTQKEQQIELLEKDKEINAVNRLVLVVLTVLITSVGVLLFLYLKTRIRKDRKIYQAERELTKANEDRLKTALEFKKLQEEKLHQELAIQNRELTTNALHIIQKNEFLDELKKQLKAIKNTEDEHLNKKIKKIIKSIDLNFSSDDDWQEFESIFQQVHKEFFEALRKAYPKLTSAEIRLCAMLRLNLDSKDISTIMGISQDSLRISRYRLRKKLGLEKGSNLYSFIMNIG